MNNFQTTGPGDSGGGNVPAHTTESAITSKRPISTTQGTSYASWAGITAAKVGAGKSYLVRITIQSLPADGSMWITLSTTKDITGSLAAWNKAGTYQVVVKNTAATDQQLYLVSVNMGGLDVDPTPPTVDTVQVNEYDDTYTPDPRSTTPALLQPIKFRDYVQAVLGKHDTGIAWDDASAKAIDTDSGYAGVGVFFDQGETIGQVIDMALQGYTACKWCDADGNMKFTRLVDPATLTPTSKKVSVRVSAEQFFVGDGATSTAQLSVNGEDVVEANVQSIYQTDWQGRVELSNAPRTNTLPNSADTSKWANRGATLTDAGTITLGSQSFHALRVASAGSVFNGVFINGAGDYYASGTTIVVTAFVRPGSSGQVLINVVTAQDGSNPQVNAGIAGPFGNLSVQSNSAGAVDAISDTLLPDGVTHKVQFRVALDYATLGADGPYVSPNSNVAGQDVVVLGAQIEATTALDHAFIPTTTTPVTVTDYTLSGSTVSFGQVPASGAVCDWTGDGTLMVAGAIDQNAMLSDLVPAQDTAPALSTRMGARRNWKKFADGDLVAPSTNFPPSVRQYLMADYQQVMASAKAINNTYIHAKYADPAPSAFDNADDAQTEIDRVCDMYTTQRWFYTTSVALDAVPGLDLGQIWRLVYPLYGLAQGKNVMVTSFQPDFIANTAQITLWG